MKIPAHEKMNNAMAQIVLKTFGMPTALTQAGMANTKIVLNTFRRNVSAVRESPTISAKRVSIYYHLPMNEFMLPKLTIISVQHVRQRQTHQRRRAEVANTVCDSYMRPMSAVCQRIGKVPRPSALEGYERQETIKSELRLVDAVVSLREAHSNVVAQRADDDGSERLPDERSQTHQADLRGGEFVWRLEHVRA